MKFPVTAFLILFIGLTSAFGQTEAIKIDLTLEPKTQSTVARGIFENWITAAKNEKTGKTPNGSLMRVRRDPVFKNKFSIWIDTNNDGNLDDEKFIVLANGAQAEVEVFNLHTLRKQNFEISLNSAQDKSYFSWKNINQAKGIIKIKNCVKTFYLQDLNANGKFEHDEGGTNFQLDRNDDGKIWGKDENLYSREIIDICGENFLISAIDDNGSFIEYSPTNLRIARIGEKTPDFNLSLIDGRTVSSDQLLGTSYILDFWASWCAPCVNKLPEIKKLGSATTVFYINTDEKDRIPQASKIIAGNDIQKDSVMNGLGGADHIWKTFARINKLLPFYVLVDKKGFIVYAGSGGDNLNKLKEKISQITD